MDYKKFYDLEGYLLDEVGPRFRKTGRLKAIDFYAILHWKAYRAKTKHLVRLRKLGQLEGVVRDLVTAIRKASTSREKLEMLMSEPWAFRLPTASAILTVLYPEEFTVYDRRVADELKKPKFRALNHASAKTVWSRYEEFLTAVKEVMPQPSLRDADRYLWGRPLYGDLAEQIGQPRPGSLARERTARQKRLRRAIEKMRGLGWDDGVARA